MLSLLKSNALPGIQIVISIVLVVVILFQASTAGVGGALGGSDGMQSFHTKRGFEKFLFIATIVLGILFAGLCILAFVLK
jgi:protein translocase SecG subunit